ncbi:hypothetical protein E2C01_028287 [Portunus trituberculatus]|uniref:EGF-like domain-containing protein n=1 Tax=Portunus trituberculatus TaxID=210409 RepID=A0A5B7ER85_PORTR|nr:hypothetical protein [Portunus trituberculatus]
MLESVLIGVSVAVMIGQALIGTAGAAGRPTVSRSATRFAVFHPEQPVLGNIPPGLLGEAHLRHKVHDVAFMLRAFRMVVKDTRLHIPQDEKDPLTKRFPKVRVPEDRKVRRHCRHDFVSCVTYLSRAARRLGMSAENDLLTLRQGRRKGMCIKGSRRLRIFCDHRHKNTKTKKEIRNAVGTLLSTSSPKKWKKRVRPSLRERLRVTKPSGGYISFILSLLKKFTQKVVISSDNSSVSNSSSVDGLELYIQTVTAMQYMCWYTMHGVPYLAHLLQCDSSAPNQTRPDGDSRANSYGDPFGCALYSFCPNPCCGDLQEPSLENCWNRFNNPCRLHGARGGQGCSVNRQLNLNYHLLVDEGVQISCDCGTGRRFEPAAHLCVWQDHCAEPAACPNPHQLCLNHYGGHACRCHPDYRWQEYNQRCVPLYIKNITEAEETRRTDKGKEEEEEEKVLRKGQERKKKVPFFKWLRDVFQRRLKVPQTPKENYEWGLV